MLNKYLLNESIPHALVVICILYISVALSLCLFLPPPATDGINAAVLVKAEKAGRQMCCS